MIINFSVQNFGCIKDKVTLSFEADTSKELEEYYIVEPKKGLRLLKLGLIYGPNASGKTTILRALDFLRQLVSEPLEKKTDSLNFNPYLLDAESPNKSTIFKIEIIQNKVKYIYEVEVNQKAVLQESLHFFNPNKALVYKRKTDEKRQLASIKFGSKIKVTKSQKAVLEGNTLWNNTVLGGYLKTNFESRELKEVTNWFIDASPIIESKERLSLLSTFLIKKDQYAKTTILDVLQKADFNVTDIQLKDKITDIELSSNLQQALEKDGILDQYLKVSNTEIIFLHRGSKNEQSTYPLLFEDQSDGTKRFYGLGGLLHKLITDKSVMIVDEIEASLHPDLLEYFILSFLLNAKHSQLIATTHYRELLMKKEILRNDAIWFTEKKKDGGIDLFSLADFDSSVIRNTSSIYNAYKIGKLGAKPNLKDHYIETRNGKK